MKKLNIGLDFGTYQTKVCIYDLDKDIHEFFKFPSNDSYFLPSVVGFHSNGKVLYGDQVHKSLKKQFNYFKIASAQDEEFLIETFEKSSGDFNIYKNSAFSPFTPELLSVLYLTYVMHTVIEVYKNKMSEKVKTGKLLKKLLKSISKDEIIFTIQLGIPTEWSQKKNLMRKRKFESILWLANELCSSMSFEKFLNMKKDLLVKHIESSLKDRPNDQLEFDKKLNYLGLSVFPETAAGLNFVLNSKQLKDGYYCIMDIGGGSTDISFFSIKDKKNINYLASESYVMAANNVYEKACNLSKTGEDIKRIENEVRAIIDAGGLSENKHLIHCIKSVNLELNKLIKKLFHRRVYFYKDGLRKGIKESYSDQNIIVYGGGSRIPTFDEGRVSIYDNGHPGICEETFLEKSNFDSFKLKDNITPVEEDWKKDFCMLVVALGLSYPKSDTSAAWYGDEDYQISDVNNDFQNRRNLQEVESAATARLVQHPFNEDCFIFDVLESKWV